MIKYLIEKEFKQLLRNSFLPRLIFIFPCMIMLLMPWAANLEIKNIRMNIIDHDHSVISRRLVDKITASTYFQITALPDSYEKGMEAIEAGTADLLLEIPRGFEKDWVNGGAANVLFAVNAVMVPRVAWEVPICLPLSMTMEKSYGLKAVPPLSLPMEICPGLIFSPRIFLMSVWIISCL